ncbi:hypothetical protein BJ998_001286 [Kutzneria kofuensis]|uniref:Uncharacterized protein n=1 Tax=Kutzneria kofuensis TaxID=103725 RepID=A0A7W9NEX8_9PSEU|nr:hypothetical protein [Kutzneria kofuensis]
MREGQAVEDALRLGVGLQGGGQIGRYLDLAGSCVERDVDIDLVPGLDAGGSAVLGAERDQELSGIRNCPPLVATVLR